jgi:hypothetical protein
MPGRRDQWILTGPCGCPFGVMEGDEADQEDKAFLEMYDYRPEQVASAKQRGMQMRLISFEQYTNEYYDQMHHPCPH